MSSGMKLLGWWDESGVELVIPNRRTPGYNGVGGTADGDETDEVDVWLVVCDLLISILWVWSGLLVKVLAYDVLGGGEALRWLLHILNVFVFAWLGTFTGGGANHPLTVLASSLYNGLSEFRPTVVWRIAAQAVGCAIGVGQVSRAFPGIAKGPELKVGIHRGAMTEGLLTFMMVTVYLGLRETAPSKPVKICISCISRLTLRTVGSDLTGGTMNPAMALGWALAQGNNITKELLYVYCLVPFEATVLAVWAFHRVTRPKRKKRV